MTHLEQADILRAQRLTRREFAVQFRGQMLNEAPDLTSDSALRRAMRARRKTRGIGYAGDGRLGDCAGRKGESGLIAASPAQVGGSIPPPANEIVDLTPLLVRFRRIDR